jgi:hypothetical protein
MTTGDIKSTYSKWQFNYGNHFNELKYVKPSKYAFRSNLFVVDLVNNQCYTHETYSIGNHF